MTIGESNRSIVPATAAAAVPCDDDCCDASPSPAERDEAWLSAARNARRLAWFSLVWMTAEGTIGLAAGLAAGSIALVGWALGSGIEGVASLIVVWRFTGSRTLSETAELRATRAVAVTFWLLAPYIAVESIRDLVGGHNVDVSVVGIALTSASLVTMPILGIAKRRLGARLASSATAGEGTQNFMCAAQAGAVLITLAVTAAWHGGAWLDPAVALLIAAWSVREGFEAWRGEDCC